MKTLFFVAVTLALLAGHNILANSSNDTSVELSSSSVTEEKFVQLMARGIKNLWTKYSKGDDQNTFVGRCFGVARKLKFVMPMIIFKLGVIITVLAFLTIFSLKSLSLLGLLVLLNVSGGIAKISAALAGKHDGKAWKPPQTVHFHVHQGKDGHYLIDHSHTAPGWDDKISPGGSEEDVGSLEAYNNLYYKLSKNPYLRTHREAYR